MTTSVGSGSRRRIENGASGEVALCAAQDLAVLVAVDFNKVSVLADIVMWYSLLLSDRELGFTSIAKRPKRRQECWVIWYISILTVGFLQASYMYTQRVLRTLKLGRYLASTSSEA